MYTHTHTHTHSDFHLIHRPSTGTKRHHNFAEIYEWGLPGFPVVKNPSSNAGEVSSMLGRGRKIPHATGQLRPRKATGEKAECFS